jgi:hypothetical protein
MYEEVIACDSDCMSEELNVALSSDHTSEEWNDTTDDDLLCTTEEVV